MKLVRRLVLIGCPIASVLFLLAATESRTSASETGRVRVGYIGDSLLQGNNWVTPDGLRISTSTSREITWARALYPFFDVDTWVDLADPRHFTGMNAGLSGDTSAQTLARVAQPARFRPDIMIVSVGINSITAGVAAHSITSDLSAICHYYLNLGMKVILANIRPVSTALIPDRDPRLEVLQTVNRWIKAFTETTENVTLWDVANAYDDGHGRPKGGYTADGIHPVSLGAQHGALSLVPLLRRLIGTPPERQPKPKNFFPNGRLGGIDGRAGNGVSGYIAHGLYARMKPRNSKNIAIASVRPNPDTGGGIQQIRFSTPGGGRDVEVFSLSMAATNVDLSALAGRWVKARCKLTLSAWNGWRAIFLDAIYMDWGALPPVTDEMIVRDWDLEIETMPFKLPLAPAPIAPVLSIFLHGDDAKGSGLLEIKQLELFAVESPSALAD
jgi:lysophospholipase L1-like esterase